MNQSPWITLEEYQSPVQAITRGGGTGKPYGLPDFGKFSAISKYVKYIFEQQTVQKFHWPIKINLFEPPLITLGVNILR